MNIRQLKTLISELPDDTKVKVKGGYFYCDDVEAEVEVILVDPQDGETFEFKGDEEDEELGSLKAETVLMII